MSRRPTSSRPADRTASRRSAPSSPSTDRAAARGQRPAREPREDRGGDAREQERRDRARRSLHISLACSGGFVLIAGVAIVLLLQSNARKAEAQAALAARRAELRAELLAEDGLAAGKAAALLQRIEATRSEWEATVDGDSIARRADQARAAIAAAAADQAVAGDLAALQRDLEAGDKSATAWQELRDRAVAVAKRTPKHAKELLQRIGELEERVAAGWFQSLLTAAAASEPRAALALLTTAEDLAADAFDAAAKDRPRQQVWAQRLHTLAPQLDAAQKQALTEPAIAAVAWSELAAPEADWVPSNGKNLTRKVQGDTVDITCEGGERAQSGVVVLRHHAWHAAALSFDVTLASGKATLFGRARGQLGEKDAGGLTLSTTEAPGCVVVPAGQEVHVEVTVVGDRMVATVANGTPQRLEQSIRHDERRGSFAAVVRPDTKLKLRQLRVRRLG